MSYSSSIGDTCYEKLCWIHIHEVADFSTSNYAEFRVGTRKHATKSSTCTKGSRVRPTSRAYGDADPGLVRPTAATAAASVLLLEKVCCRCRTAVVVVVAPAARSSLCWTHVRCRFFVFKLCRISSWGSTKHTANRARVQRVQGLDRQDERTATLTLASCALLLLLLLLTVCFLKRMNPNVTDTYDCVRRCSFVLVQHNNPYSPSMMHRRFDYCRN